jgi:hypothetical protein
MEKCESLQRGTAAKQRRFKNQAAQLQVVPYQHLFDLGGSYVVLDRGPDLNGKSLILHGQSAASTNQ